MSRTDNATREFGKLRPTGRAGEVLGAGPGTGSLAPPASVRFILNGAACSRGKIFENYPQNSENKLSTMVVKERKIMLKATK